MVRDDLYHMSLGEIAMRIPSAWDFFESHGVSFCSNGFTDLRSWCTGAGKDVQSVMDELWEARTSSKVHWENERSLTVLCDHIVKEYHQPQRAQAQTLLDLVAKAVAAAPDHADREALSSLEQGLKSYIQYLLNHFEHEELEAFVQLREIDIYHPVEPAQPMRMQFGQISDQVRHWENEHMEATVDAEKLFCRIRDYVQCANPTPEIVELGDFAAVFIHVLRRHIHFENFVLIPACMRVEQVLAI